MVRLATQADLGVTKANDDIARVAKLLEQAAVMVAQLAQKPAVMIPQQRDVQTIPVPVPMKQPSYLEANIKRDEAGRASSIVIVPHYDE